MSDPRLQKKVNNEREILTVQEVAEILNIHPNTVRDLLKAGVLKGFRLRDRSRWRISRAELDNFTSNVTKGR